MRQRQITNCLQSAEAEWLPTYRLNERIAEARRRMGERRWAELNAEWETEGETK